MTILDDGIEVDYAGTSGLASRGINVPPAYCRAYSCFGIKCVVAPEIPNNWASLAPFRMKIPEGCILNAPWPYPVSVRHVIGHLLPDLMMGCLHQAVPERVTAEGASALWNITELTSLKLTASRSTQETILQGASGLFDTTIEASVEHEFLRNVLLSLGVTFDDGDYKGIKQTDDTYGINAAVRWKINRYLTAGAQVNYTKRSSNVGIDRFDRNQVIIDLKGQF